jgi:hypothetical protein
MILMNGEQRGSVIVICELTTQALVAELAATKP